MCALNPNLSIPKVAILSWTDGKSQVINSYQNLLHVTLRSLSVPPSQRISLESGSSGRNDPLFVFIRQFQFRYLFRQKTDHLRRKEDAVAHLKQQSCACKTASVWKPEPGGGGGGGAHSTIDSVLALHPAAPGSILHVHEKFSKDLGKNNSVLQRNTDGPA